MCSGGKTSSKSEKQMKKNHNIAGNEPCATEICEELKQIFIQLRASAWAEKSAEDHETKAQVYRERQDVVQKMRGLRQHMETIQFRHFSYQLAYVHKSVEFVGEDYGLLFVNLALAGCCRDKEFPVFYICVGGVSALLVGALGRSVSVPLPFL
jgi:hypothetical protein